MSKLTQNKKSNLFLIAAILVMFGFRLIPGNDSLSAEGLAVLGIFFGSLLMWIGVSIDWPSMITILMLGFLPSFSFADTFKGAFGNTTWLS